MNLTLHDTARVRDPRASWELRLGTVTAVEPQPDGTRGDGYRLRFPTGDTSWYHADEITGCTRDDDRAALVTALTEVCRSLRDACRIAHDHDDELSADISFYLACLVGIARTRLDLTLDPAAPDPAADPTPDEARS
jgi:hypothetical protein